MAGHAIKDGRIIHVSATQIGLYQRCPRKWHIQYKEGIKPPPTPNLAIGESTHTIFQDVYEGARPPLDLDPDDTAVPIQERSLSELLKDERLPRPNSGTLLVEYPRDYMLGIRAAGVPVKGRIDLLHLLYRPGQVRIIDLKTSSSIRKYGLSPAELATNTQLVLYAHWAFERDPLLESITVTHAYAGTKKVEADVVDSDPLDRAHVQGQFAVIETSVAQMTETARVSSWEAVAGNEDACWDYGGCPFQQMCGACGIEARSPENLLTLEQLMARKRASGINPPDAAQPDPLPPTPLDTSVRALPDIPPPEPESAPTPQLSARELLARRIKPTDG